MSSVGPMEASRPLLLRAVIASLRPSAASYASLTAIFAWITTALLAAPAHGLAAGLPSLGGVAVLLAGGALMSLDVPPGARPIVPIVALLVMGGGFALFMVSMPVAAHGVSSTAAVGPSLMKVALVAYCVNAGPGYAPARYMVVASVGVEGLAVVVGRLNGTVWRFDLYLFFLALSVALGFIVLRAALARSSGADLIVREAGVEESLRHMRGVARSQVAAVVHETILNDLAVIATTEPGRVPARLEHRLLGTLRLLASPDWVDGPAAEPTEELFATDSVQRAVQRARGQGLTVLVDGELGRVAHLPPRTERALGGAVEQCLVNTIRHAHVDTAEVSILGDAESVAVMISDGGDGFDADAVVEDRLGIRGSVRSRIEEVGGTVRIFAKPGLGTSVLISVPIRAMPAQDVHA